MTELHISGKKGGLYTGGFAKVGVLILGVLSAGGGMGDVKVVG